MNLSKMNVDLSGGTTYLPPKTDSKNTPSGEYIEGSLYRNADGRFEVKRKVLYSGSPVELQLCGQWLKTKMDVTQEGTYYAAGLKGLKLEGVPARVCV